MKDSFEQNSTWAAMRSPLPQTHRPGFCVYTRQTHGTKETLFEGTFKIEPKILFCFLFTSRANGIWETLEKCFPEHQKRNIDKEIKWKSVCVFSLKAEWLVAGARLWWKREALCEGAVKCSLKPFVCTDTVCHWMCDGLCGASSFLKTERTLTSYLSVNKVENAVF